MPRDPVVRLPGREGAEHRADPTDEELDLFTEHIGRDLERAATDLLKLLGMRSREESEG